MPEGPTCESLEHQNRELERQNAFFHNYYRAMVDNSMDAILLTTPDGRVFFANQAACDLFQMKKPEINSGGRKTVVDEEVFRLPAEIKESVRNGKYMSELVLEKKDGTKFPGEVSSSIFKDPKGRLLTRVIIRDLTERKRIEEYIWIYQNIVSSTPDGIAFLDKSYRYVIVNDAYEKFSGIKRDNFIGRSVADYLGEDVFMRIIKPNIDRCLQGELIHCQGWLDYPALGKRFVHITYYPYRDRSNGITGVIANTRDLTERKQAEEALRQSEAKYRTMMESMTDPVCTCSPEFTVQYMNPAMIRRTGRDAIGEKCYHALHALDDKCDWCRFEKIAQGESFEEKIISPKDNRSYRVTNMPIQNQDGSISKMTIFRDITDYLSAVEEKEKVKAQLLQSQKMESIGNLAGGIAHDFNNILSSIIGYTELALEDVKQGTPLEESLQEIFSAGRRAKDLIKQILTFARQSGEERKPIRIATIAEEALRLIRVTIPSTIEIRQIFESSSLIMGNPTQINQIFINLCTNAAHAMEDAGGILRIDIRDVSIDDVPAPSLKERQPGNYIQIKVADTGLGIPADIIESIFDPYFTTKKPGEGTGLGLALVHGIVESHGGKIKVESNMEVGTVFTIHLPLTKECDVYASNAEANSPTGSERILLVDDEALIIKMASQILERLGYRVSARTSSIEALELFRAKPKDFDLVITDMAMPNMNGDKLALELMKIKHDVPIVLCTGYSTRISEETAAKIGVKAFVYKPVTKTDLARTIRAVLDGSMVSTHA